MAFISGNVAPLPLVMVVEYLQSSMSTELLTKFPDNSAFDFDYSQSSIWSPLLRRFQPEITGGRIELSGKLSFVENGEVGLLENTKRVAARIKKRFADAVIGNICRFRRMKRRNSKSFGFSPLPCASASPKPKTWGTVMKAAAKHFKKRKKKNSGNGNVRLDFSDYMD